VIEFRVMSRRTDVLGDFLSQHPTARSPAPLSLPRWVYLHLVAALMPLHHWKRSYTALRYYEQLRRSQWLPPEQIRALQEARLRTVIRHAYRHVPYYRELLDQHGVDPNHVRHLADLQRLPILSKETVRRTLHFDLMSDAHDKRQMLPVSTSGASGEPLTLYVEKTQLEMRWANTLRNQEWTGYRFGDRQVRLWDMNLPRAPLQALRDRLDGLLARRTTFSAVAAGADDLQRAAALVRRRPGALVRGEAAALQLIAAAMPREQTRNGGVRAVLSSGQTLSAAARDAIQEGFQSAVFDSYASREFDAIAQECEVHGGYHVNAESYIVEVVRDGRPVRAGEEGDVLVTDLSNLCVPLIRYAIGDRAVAAADRPCACGRGLPLIESVRGRSAAVIVGGEGRVVPAEFFYDVLRDYGHVVRRFQVVQSQPGAVELRIVKGPRYSAAALQKLLDLLRQYLGTQLTVEVEPVDLIPFADDGAPMPVVSLAL